MHTLHHHKIQNLLLEVTTEINTTEDRLKLGEGLKLGELGVLADSEITTNLGELGEGDVGDLLVVDERDRVLDLSQVGSREGLHLIALVELERASLLQVGNVESLDALELNLTSALELRHRDRHAGAVDTDGEGVGDVLKVRVELDELTVVVDLESLDSGELQAAQVVDEGIGDGDDRGLGNTLAAEGNLGQKVELPHRELVKALESCEANGVEEFEVGQLKTATNRVDGAGRDGQELGGVGNDQVTLDLLGALNGKSASHLTVDSNIGIDNIAVD